MEKNLTLYNGQKIPQLAYGTWFIRNEDAARCVKVALEAAKLMHNISSSDYYAPYRELPTSNNDVLVTICDTSVVDEAKNLLGNNYAVALLPYVNNDEEERLTTLSGCKLFGVNNSLSSSNKEMAFDVARFLTSEHAQTKRFEARKMMPTLKSVQSLANGEPHIAAINQQKASADIIPLAYTFPEIWMPVATASMNIRNLPSNATNSQYIEILQELDSELSRNS